MSLTATYNNGALVVVMTCECESSATAERGVCLSNVQSNQPRANVPVTVVAEEETLNINMETDRQAAITRGFVAWSDVMSLFSVVARGLIDSAPSAQFNTIVTSQQTTMPLAVSLCSDLNIIGLSYFHIIDTITATSVVKSWSTHMPSCNTTKQGRVHHDVSRQLSSPRFGASCFLISVQEEPFIHGTSQSNVLQPVWSMLEDLPVLPRL
jgi:hypothetical protein